MTESFAEADCLPLSALQHLLFCERQCALIHLEGLWAENSLTVEGRHMHEKVDEQGSSQAPGGVRIARGLPIRCLRLGLSGKADAVEFHPVTEGGAALTAAPGRWRPFPVEYKHGKPKRDRCDEVQICAQALCLEEMLGVPVPDGALFYGKTRHRLGVTFDAELRKLTEDTAARLRALIESGVTPKAVKQPKCEHCSLLSLCLPEANAPSRSASRYLAAVFEERP
jgi:CRISPR-associated exonuclease Cas4